MYIQHNSQEIRWSGKTDVGRFRTDNEDAFLSLLINSEGVCRLGKYGQAMFADNDYIFAVSDGMGGANAGEFASQITIEKITQLFPQRLREASSDFEQGSKDLLNTLFQKIHYALSHMGQSYKELEGMGATLSLCWVRPSNLIYYAHVGDSRIYQLPVSGGIEQISHDHTNVGWQQREGQLTELQVRNHPGRNVLQQVLGGKTQNISPQLGTIRYDCGDVFLICSDGLVEGLWDSGIERVIRKSISNSSADVADRLVKEAVQTDGHDNTTALAFELVQSHPEI